MNGSPGSNYCPCIDGAFWSQQCFLLPPEKPPEKAAEVGPEASAHICCLCEQVTLERLCHGVYFMPGGWQWIAFSFAPSVCRQWGTVQASLQCPVAIRSFCACDGQAMPGMSQRFTHIRCHWALLPSGLGMLSEGSNWVFLAGEGFGGTTYSVYVIYSQLGTNHFKLKNYLVQESFRAVLGDMGIILLASAS